MHDASFHDDLLRKAVHVHEHEHDNVHVDDNVDVEVLVDVSGFCSMPNDSKRKENKMTRNPEKTVFRDSGNGRFISKGQSARRPRNTWQKERGRVGIRSGNPRIIVIKGSLFAGAGTNTSRSAGRIPPAWWKIEEHESLERIEFKIDQIEECIDALLERFHERY